MKKKLILYTDGGARGNPGPAGAGVAIFDEKGKLVRKLSKFLGKTTNNQAEYQALILGLGKAIEMEADEVSCFLDSELIVRQLQGKYKVKNDGLKPLFGEVLGLMNNFEKIEFRHILREKNKLADKLVNHAIDKGS
jgi:ribonuclease HI